MTTQMIDRLQVQNPEPGYKYRWCNSRDFCMLTRIHEGWEPAPQPTDRLATEVANVLGQSTAAPAGGATVARGDLVLMRMRTEAFEKNIALPKRLARERQTASFDTMVSQANENTQRALKQAGITGVPANIVYQTSADGEFAQDKEK